MSVPSSFEAVRSQLEPRVVGAVPERLRRHEAGPGTERDQAVVSAGVEELLTGAVIPLGPEKLPVTPFLAERWRVEPGQLLVAALEVGRDRQSPFSLRSDRPGVWRTTDAEQIPLLLRARTWPTDIALDGDPVLIAATWRTAYLAGADDLDGLAAAVGSAAADLLDRPLDVVSARAVVRRASWEAFVWPDPRRTRWRDRRAVGHLTDVVRGLEAAFREACELVRDRTGREGLPIRRVLGEVTTDESVLQGWVSLATAFGLDDREAGRVREAAVDSLRYFDAHQAEFADSFLDRDEFRAEHALLVALVRRGAVIGVSRKSQREYVEAVVAESPAAVAAGARITLADEYDHAVALAEDIAAKVDPFDVAAVVVGEGGSDLDLVLFPGSRRAEVEQAERLLGSALSLYWL